MVIAFDTVYTHTHIHYKGSKKIEKPVQQLPDIIRGLSYGRDAFGDSVSRPTKCNLRKKQKGGGGGGDLAILMYNIV